MTTALTIANTILAKAFDENIDMTCMKLQKLTYILYKEYLQQTGKPLFSERFEVWKYGPVLHSIQNIYSEFGSNRISKLKSNTDGIYVINLQTSTEFNNIFEKFWNTYKAYAGTYLAELTYANNTAWYKAAIAHQTFLSDNDIQFEQLFI